MNHVVLYQPEIPQNTGNIMRTCVAINARLHLIKPLGFSLEEKYLKRAAANYLEHLDYRVHDSIEAFFAAEAGTYYFLSRYGLKSPDELDVSAPSSDVYFFFGSESTGIPKAILKPHLDRCFRLPMSTHIRSLNLANTVAIVMYEVMRQQDYPGLSKKEPEIYKGADYLLK